MKLIDRATDMIFPRRCPVCDDAVDQIGHLICRDCFEKLTLIGDVYCMKCGKRIKDAAKTLCDDCTTHRQSFDEGRAVFVYDDIMKNSIYRFKYGNRKEYCDFYANITIAVLKRQIEIWKPDVIVPIPVHKNKLRERGYNQAQIYAKELGEKLRIPVNDDILVRVENTKVQKGLTAVERKNNLKKALKIKKYVVELKNVLLIDDIYTTGSTINAAAECMKEAGAKNIYFIVLSAGENN